MNARTTEEKHLDALVNDFAIRSFRDIADGDYIAARLCYRSQLLSQFLWLSLQAIEKYLKCILLLNRIEARKVRHELSKALKKIERHAPFDLKLSDSTREFIEYLDTYGRFRYFESSYHNRWYEMVRLDKAVWEIRRYCQPINYTIKNLRGKEVDMLPLNLDIIERSENASPHKFSLMNGVLEKINRDENHPSRSALIWQNGFFGKMSRKTLRVTPFMQAHNSPLSLHPEVLDEVKNYVLITKEVTEAYQGTT